MIFLWALLKGVLIGSAVFWPIALAMLYFGLRYIDRLFKDSERRKP